VSIEVSETMAFRIFFRNDKMLMGSPVLGTDFLTLKSNKKLRKLCFCYLFKR